MFSLDFLLLFYRFGLLVHHQGEVDNPGQARVEFTDGEVGIKINLNVVVPLKTFSFWYEDFRSSFATHCRGVSNIPAVLFNLTNCPSSQLEFVVNTLI